MSSTPKSPAERIQSWMPTDLADQLRAQVLLERRAISQVVRLAVESRLQTDQASPRAFGEGRAPDGPLAHPSRGAGSED